MPYIPWILIGIASLITAGYALYNLGFTNIHHHVSPEPGAKRVACVGDSITYGCGIWNWAIRNYPKVLGDLLGVSWHVENFGVNGRTAVTYGDYPYSKEKEYRLSFEYLPEVVVLMFGSNDSRPQNWQGKASFMDQIEQLVVSYQVLDSKPEVILCTPATPYYAFGKKTGKMIGDIRAEEVAEAAEMIKSLGLKLDLKVVDVHTLTHEHPEWFKFDGIHPNRIGAEAIAQTIYQTLTR